MQSTSEGTIVKADDQYLYDAALLEAAYRLLDEPEGTESRLGDTVVEYWDG